MKNVRGSWILKFLAAKALRKKKAIAWAAKRVRLFQSKLIKCLSQGRLVKYENVTQELQYIVSKCKMLLHILFIYCTH